MLLPPLEGLLVELGHHREHRLHRLRDECELNVRTGTGATTCSERRARLAIGIVRKLTYYNSEGNTGHNYETVKICGALETCELCVPVHTRC